MAPGALLPEIDVDTRPTSPSYASNGHLPVQQPIDYRGYDHVTWWVNNAKQVAQYYITRMGFRPVAFRDLSTGSRALASHVVENGSVRFVLTSPIRASSRVAAGKGKVGEKEQRVLDEIYDHLDAHGDAVKDVAFAVDDARTVYEGAVARGAEGVMAPTEESDKEGSVVIARIRTYGTFCHPALLSYLKFSANNDQATQPTPSSNAPTTPAPSFPTTAPPPPQTTPLTASSRPSNWRQ